MAYNFIKKYWTHVYSNVNKFSKEMACVYCGITLKEEHKDKCNVLHKKQKGKVPKEGNANARRLKKQAHEGRDKPKNKRKEKQY